MIANNLLEEVKKRDLPPLENREEMLKRLKEGEFGALPEIPYTVSYSEPKPEKYNLWKPSAKAERIFLTVKTELGEHTFPFWHVYHADGGKRPAFVFLNFRSELFDRYIPTEEVWERGYDVFQFCYEDVTNDSGEFSDGLAKCFYSGGVQKDGDAGKIVLWSFAASRVLDYALTLPWTDEKNVAVIGHSRLGKTALYTGAFDARFTYAFSNDSGCSGASLCRGNECRNNGKEGHPDSEDIADITRQFPWWFEKNYSRFSKNNAPDGFDQHFLLGAISPRYVYVASASCDFWADPVSEFYACVAASPAWEEKGLTGFECDRFPAIGESFQKGRVGYHLREGNHFLSRFDWMKYCDFIDAHKDDVR